jgi:glycosyltransferase involved in cell wall biosynthesis
MAGIRGVPASFGGSETAAEQIGRRLASDGVSVVIYCRKHNSRVDQSEYCGMKTVVLPSINTFNFDTISHSLLASLHMLLTNSADVIHFHGVGNGLVAPLFALSRKKVVFTIDGPDWERPKWGKLARLALRLGAHLAIRMGDCLIIDNVPAMTYFESKLRVKGTLIPYGADFDLPSGNETLLRLGLEPRQYLLFVGALVPDKGPDLLLEAFRQVDTEMPLVLIGDSPFFPDYRARLRGMAEVDTRVRMLGYQYGEPYRQLLANAYAYVHPLRSDGTSPALLQAMAYGSCIVVNSLPEALSAVGEAAIRFDRDDPADLAEKLTTLLHDSHLAASYRRRARARAEAEYSWERVATQHWQAYASLYEDNR